MARHPGIASALDNDRGAGRTPSAQAAPVRFEVHPGRVFQAGCLALLLLVALNFAGLAVRLRTDGPFLLRISRLVVLDNEANIPTLFNYALLVGVLFLLVTLTLRANAAADPWRHHWLGLSLIFLFLSYDEAAQMHEELTAVAAGFVDRVGIFYWTWVVPGALFVLVVAAAFLRFVLALRRPEAWLVVLGGLLYVGGAIGVEMIGGDYASRHGMLSPTYLLIATVEETLEMLGLLVFGYALLGLLADPDGTIRLRPTQR